MTYYFIMKNTNLDYDVVLYIDNDHNIQEEFADPRTRPAAGTKSLGYGYDIRFGYLKGTQGNQYFNYGSVLRNSLSLGKEYAVEVVDFGSEIYCKVTYNNSGTGKSASKSFLVVLDLSQKGGKGMVKSSMAKWRSISDVSQAASYIRSYASALSGRTGQD